MTSWRDPSGAELLFVSAKAVFAPPKAIRGGVPVCWPQFSDMGPLGQHGFARNAVRAVRAACARQTACASAHVRAPRPRAPALR